MGRIRAAVCHNFGEPLRIEEVELAAPEGREIEVTLDACAVCHSDIAYASGAWGGALPAVYGHEAAGRVSALGPAAEGYSVGDRVLVTLIRACGTCPSCVTARPSICTGAARSTPLTTTRREPIFQAMDCGAFAEKVVVDPSQIAPVPDAMPLDVASLLSCGVITGVGAVVNAGKVRPGEHVVVIGAGGVGLNAIQGAKIAGAARIVAVDMTEAKLDDARAFGATDGILASDPKPWATLRDLTGRLADAVFVTVGAASIYDTAPRYLAPGGRLVMVGLPPSGSTASYAPDILASLGQSLIGTKMGDTVLSRDIPWLADLYLQGRLKLDELISARWPLERINEAIADTRAGHARRNVIVFDR
ncbi:MAG: Zn-dependent alcohol dehydrogenase [Silicimonas sp.]|nr:Zn-dependent alcohol dehydrogenase [Silicimonas sp.]